MPIFKNKIAHRLARWITAATRPHHLVLMQDDPLLDDLAAGADEIERLTAALDITDALILDLMGMPWGPVAYPEGSDKFRALQDMQVRCVERGEL